MKKRIFGIETEFGCMTNSERIRGTSEGIAARVRDYVFDTLHLGIRDIHYRDWGEPPGNGGFLFNGGRLYIDMGHLEYATPECGKLFELIAYDKAIERIIINTLRETAFPTVFFKNNIDHFSGTTFGCHENFQISREIPFYRVVIPTILPFLVTRQIYAGTGRVGTYDETGEFSTTHSNINQHPYQISQRADHIVTEVYEWIQFSRAIVNTRDEPLSDYTKYRRLHLLVGDTNMSEYATALKVGTTALVIALIEQRKIPETLALANPIDTIKTVSHDQTYRWLVMTADGKTMSAIDHQRKYLALAQKFMADAPGETDWILAEWEDTLDALEKDPMALTDRLDWVAKKWLLETFAEEEGIAWEDPWLQSLDLEYHNIHLKEGLYYGLPMRRVVTDEQIDTAIHNPPPGTRAYFRGGAVHRFSESIKAIQWDSITFTVKGRAISVNMNALANPEVATQYNQALDESPDVETLIKKLGFS